MEATDYANGFNNADQFEAELKIREESRSWSPAQWERYLKSMEVEMTEAQISASKYKRLSEVMEFDAFSFAQNPASPALVDRIRFALEDLTTQQRRAVELVFYKSKSTRQAAEEMGLKQSTIRDLIRKAIKSLRRHFEGGTLILPVVEGQVSETTQTE